MDSHCDGVVIELHDRVEFGDDARNDHSSKLRGSCRSHQQPGSSSQGLFHRRDMQAEVKYKLPKQWKDWCRRSGLSPMTTRFKGRWTWHYLKGHGRVWRVNCYVMFQCGDTLKDFDRWALCSIKETPIPQSKAEFKAVVKKLLEQQRS